MRVSSGPFREEYIEPYWQEGKCGFKVIKDYEKSRAIPCIYDSYIILSGDTVALKRSGKWGILSHKNEIVCDFIFDRIEKTDYWSRVCIAMRGGNWGLINVKDGSSETGFKYDFARPLLIETISAAEINGDLRGGGRERWKRESQYWLLYSNGKVFIFGDDGNMVYHMGFEDMIASIQFGLYSSNIGFIVQDKGMFGVLKYDGDFLCKCEFDEIKEFYGHIQDDQTCLCHILVRKNNHWGLINHEGKFILRCEFDEIKTAGNTVAVKHNNQWGIIPFTELFKYGNVYSLNDTAKAHSLSFKRG